MFFWKYAAPTVALGLSLNFPSLYCKAIDVFPTPELPIRTILASSLGYPFLIVVLPAIFIFGSSG
jgi:hypothetical protein